MPENAMRKPTAPVLVYPNPKLSVKSSIAQSAPSSGELSELVTIICADDIIVNKGFNEMARWYLALSYIKINENENAVNALNSIIDNPSSNYKKEAASEVLSFLD